MTQTYRTPVNNDDIDTMYENIILYLNNKGAPSNLLSAVSTLYKKAKAEQSICNDITNNRREKQGD